MDIDPNDIDALKSLAARTLREYPEVSLQLLSKSELMSPSERPQVPCPERDITGDIAVASSYL
ncbi:rhamnulokinase [Mycolicibacterium canariasense]|uniref:Rhamnulokinase n=1 Tax=Mycolicibacterium canariasense TaxID=228230 RepID=A0A117I935_MYCCR|nr:rhamnulokinase [Mycolicibacterium canariasense]